MSADASKPGYRAGACVDGPCAWLGHEGGEREGEHYAGNGSRGEKY